MTNTYANKGLAAAAAKRAGIENTQPVKIGNARWVNMTESQIAQSPLFNASLRARSNVSGSVALVWDIAAIMIEKGAARADILSKCVDAGVNINTARTQLQAYRKAAGLVKARA